MRNKYGARKTNGYHSKREADRGGMLELYEKAGHIRNLRKQVTFELIPKQDGERACNYIADFVYEEPVTCKLVNGDPVTPTHITVVEDCKGYRDPIYRIKRKLMLKVHGIRIRET
jgi:hypothetical protein